MAYINKINVDGVEYEVKDENALPAANLPEAINTALTQAKESGEFDYTLTEADKQEIAELAANLVPSGGGGSGVEEVYVGTDTPPSGTKVWINPNGVATFPMPTADDAGKVLKAKGANEAEWGEASGGGGGAFVVTFGMTSDGAVTADKTWQEIYDAYFVDGKQVSGVLVNAHNDHGFCQLTGINGDDAIFICNQSNASEMGLIRLCLSRTKGDVTLTVFALTSAT